MNEIDLIFLDTIQRFSTCEHRHLVKEPNGTFRQETDEEFKKRLVEKYNKGINRIKSIDDYAKAMYAQAHIRWEEMNVENAPTDELVRARDMIQKELNKRQEIE